MNAIQHVLVVLLYRCPILYFVWFTDIQHGALCQLQTLTNISRLNSVVRRNVCSLRSAVTDISPSAEKMSEAFGLISPV